MENNDSVVIRNAGVADAEAMAELSGELGYPVSPETMVGRIEELSLRNDRAVYVACSAQGTVLGWIDVGIAMHLQAAPRAEIGGLVVSSRTRSKGIGRLLVAHAEQWAESRGVNKMVVRSRVAREGAHRFYEREGYERVKTQMVFEKVLDH